MVCGGGGGVWGWGAERRGREASVGGLGLAAERAGRELERGRQRWGRGARVEARAAWRGGRRSREWLPRRRAAATLQRESFR